MAESEKPKKKSKGYEHKIVKKILKAKDSNGQLILTDDAFTSAIEVCVCERERYQLAPDKRAIILPAARRPFPVWVLYIK
jgi:DNA phosphorothioation-dependent restriction protein DptG